MFLLKSLAKITLCVGLFLVRTFIWSWIFGMSGRYVVCKGMYRFIKSSGVSGLLDILRMCKGKSSLGLVYW